MTDRGGKIYCQLLEAQRIQGVTDNRGGPSPMPNTNKWLKNNSFLDVQCEFNMFMCTKYK